MNEKVKLLQFYKENFEEGTKYEYSQTGTVLILICVCCIQR